MVGEVRLPESKPSADRSVEEPCFFPGVEFSSAAALSAAMKFFCCSGVLGLLGDVIGEVTRDPAGLRAALSSGGRT